jgi:hypothetical protein
MQINKGVDRCNFLRIFYVNNKQDISGYSNKIKIISILSSSMLINVLSPPHHSEVKTTT